MASKLEIICTTRSRRPNCLLWLFWDPGDTIKKLPGTYIQVHTDSRLNYESAETIWPSGSSPMDNRLSCNGIILLHGIPLDQTNNKQTNTERIIAKCARSGQPPHPSVFGYNIAMLKVHNPILGLYDCTMELYTGTRAMRVLYMRVCAVRRVLVCSAINFPKTSFHSLETVFSLRTGTTAKSLELPRSLPCESSPPAEESCSWDSWPTGET